MGMPCVLCMHEFVISDPSASDLISLRIFFDFLDQKSLKIILMVADKLILGFIVTLNNQVNPND